MALSKEIIIDNKLEKLYYKILSISKNDDVVQINVGVFKSKEDATNIVNIEGYGKFEFTPNNNDNNLIKQAYEYLKTLPGFEDFEDI